MRLFWLLGLAVLFFPFMHVRAEAPVPPDKKDRLEALEYNLENQKQGKKTLESEVRKIEKDLETTKKHLVELAASIRLNESTLRDLEARMGELEQEKLGVQDRLKSGQRSASRLILALERLRRVPPEALIAKPGAPFQAAQSAMLMRNIIPALHAQAETLRADLVRLEEITADLEAKRKTAIETADQLRSEQKKLSGLVRQREKLYASTRDDLAEQEENIKRISRQARTLQELVRKLDEEEAARKIVMKKPSGPLPKTGRAQLPVSGSIRTGYDTPDPFGAPSKGLTIEARPGALVTAPMGGVVRFAGYFRNHGNMIILEHDGGYHSLIAGLKKIDTVVGQNVSAGEPLGALDDAGGGEKPSLYYELRLDGRPVNPASKFAGVG